jgi:hypothetical protein
VPDLRAAGARGDNEGIREEGSGGDTSYGAKSPVPCMFKKVGLVKIDGRAAPLLVEVRFVFVDLLVG